MQAPSDFDGFKKTGSDVAVEEALAAHCATFGIGPLDAVKLFPVLARRQWLKRFLAHVELFTKTLEVPGDVAELGVFRGVGLLTWANLLESYCIGDRTKTVWGFDNWAGFTKLDPQDGREIQDAGKVTGGFACGHWKQELEAAIAIFDRDRFIPWKPRVRLVDGDIERIGEWAAANPGVRFSFVHFDCDLYAPTKAALEVLWPRLSVGGIVIFDEYGMHDWPGETQAVDEFFRDSVEIKTLPWTNAPGGYIVKGVAPLNSVP